MFWKERGLENIFQSSDFFFDLYYLILFRMKQNQNWRNFRSKKIRSKRWPGKNRNLLKFLDVLFFVDSTILQLSNAVEIVFLASFSAATENIKENGATLNGEKNCNYCKLSSFICTLCISMVLPVLSEASTVFKRLKFTKFYRISFVY